MTDVFSLVFILTLMSVIFSQVIYQSGDLKENDTRNISKYEKQLILFLK